MKDEKDPRPGSAALWKELENAHAALETTQKENARRIAAAAARRAAAMQALISAGAQKKDIASALGITPAAVTHVTRGS